MDDRTVARKRRSSPIRKGRRRLQGGRKPDGEPTPSGHTLYVQDLSKRPFWRVAEMFAATSGQRMNEATARRVCRDALKKLKGRLGLGNRAVERFLEEEPC